MNKKELIDAVADGTGVTRATAGEALEIAASRSAAFKPGKALRDRLN